MSGDVAVAPERRMALRAVPGAFPIGGVLGLAGLAGAAAVYLLSAYRISYVVCYFKLVTGIPCMTCGGTRATMRLLRLDLAGALAMNPLVTVFGMLVAAWALADAVLFFRRRALRLQVSPAVARALRIAIPLAVLVNWGYLIAAGR